MGPLELEVVHGGSTAGKMRRIVGRVDDGIGLPAISKVGGGSDWTKSLGGGEGVKGRSDLFGDVEDGLDASLEEPLPVPGVVL